MQGDLFSQMQPKPRTKEYRQYTPDEIMQSSVEYFHGDELAANVWMNKYALRDDDKIFEIIFSHSRYINTKFLVYCRMNFKTIVSNRF